MIEGRVKLSDCGRRIVLDALPYVMSKVRPIFSNAKGYHEKGEFTHRPLSFSINPATAKDVEWVSSRYSIVFSDDSKDLVSNLARKHDAVKLISSTADADKEYRLNPGSLPLAIPLREHQVQFRNMFYKMGRMLLADKMGLGKTASAISVIQDPDRRPALIVVPAHLRSQWDREVKRFLPGATTHVINGRNKAKKALPAVDAIIAGYNMVGPWSDELVPYGFKTLILDECQELRHTGTIKRDSCRAISEVTPYVLGLSGTPIYNYGNEIWSVIDAIYPQILGENSDFTSEWCSWSGSVTNPASLNQYLRSAGLMLRRESFGAPSDKPSKHIITLDTDLSELQKIQDIAKTLALSVLGGEISQMSEHSREFDWKLRHATGVSKAKPVAEFVKMIVGQGDKVLLAGWHRDVYEIWKKEFRDIKHCFYTGSESAFEKNRAVSDFVEGDAKIFIISLRSGAGLDGLQRVCNHVVFGELDWSPQVMDQVVARLDRDGQTKHVQAYYLNIADGADPFMISTVSEKRSQHDGLVEGKDGGYDVLETSPESKDRIRNMAAAYLKSIGEEVPNLEPKEGLLADVCQTLESVKSSHTTEDELQRSLFEVLSNKLPDAKVEREVSISKRSRLDILVSKGTEKVAIECKITQYERKRAYDQVRRYVSEAGATSFVIVAPWFGVKDFKVDGTPVSVVNLSQNSI